MSPRLLKAKDFPKLQVHIDGEQPVRPLIVSNCQNA